MSGDVFGHHNLGKCYCHRAEGSQTPSGQKDNQTAWTVCARAQTAPVTSVLHQLFCHSPPTGVLSSESPRHHPATLGSVVSRGLASADPPMSPPSALTTPQARQVTSPQSVYTLPSPAGGCPGKSSPLPGASLDQGAASAPPARSAWSSRPRAQPPGTLAFLEEGLWLIQEGPGLSDATLPLTEGDLQPASRVPTPPLLLASHPQPQEPRTAPATSTPRRAAGAHPVPSRSSASMTRT